MALLNNKEVGKRLEGERIKTNLSRRKFALAAKVDPSHYNKIESGNLPVTAAILKKLMDRYGFDKEYVLYGKEYGINVPRGIEQFEKLRTKNVGERQELGDDISSLIKAVLTLTESNKTLVDTNSRLEARLPPNSNGIEPIS